MTGLKKIAVLSLLSFTMLFGMSGCASKQTVNLPVKETLEKTDASVKTEIIEKEETEKETTATLENESSAPNENAENSVTETFTEQEEESSLTSDAKTSPEKEESSTTFSNSSKTTSVSNGSSASSKAENSSSTQQKEEKDKAPSASTGNNSVSNVSYSSNASSAQTNSSTSAKKETTGKTESISSQTTAQTNASDKASESVHTHTWQEQYKVVHHDETGHYETVTKQEAWTEYLPEYTQTVHVICNGCGADLTAWSEDQLIAHGKAGFNKGCGGWHEEVQSVQTGTQVIKHPAVTEQKYVVDKEAYSEKVSTGYKCSGCQATKSN
jgi:hypothetical protein